MPPREVAPAAALPEAAAPPVTAPLPKPLGTGENLGDAADRSPDKLLPLNEDKGELPPALGIELEGEGDELGKDLPENPREFPDALLPKLFLPLNPKLLGMDKLVRVKGVGNNGIADFQRLSPELTLALGSPVRIQRDTYPANSSICPVRCKHYAHTGDFYCSVRIRSFLVKHSSIH